MIFLKQKFMKQLFLVISALFSINLFGQSFEGTLTYVSDIEVAEKMKKNGITKEMLIAQMKQDGSYSDTVGILPVILFSKSIDASVTVQIFFASPACIAYILFVVALYTLQDAGFVFIKV